MLIYILTIAIAITLSRLFVLNENRELAAIGNLAEHKSPEYIHFRKRRLQHYKRVTLFAPLTLALVANIYLVKRYDAENVNIFLTMIVGAIAAFQITVVNWFGFRGACRCIRESDEEQEKT